MSPGRPGCLTRQWNTLSDYFVIGSTQPLSNLGKLIHNHTTRKVVRLEATISMLVETLLC